MWMKDGEKGYKKACKYSLLFLPSLDRTSKLGNMADILMIWKDIYRKCLYKS